MHNFVTYVLEILFHCVIQIFQMLIHFIRKLKKITFVKITTDLIRKPFNYWETIRLMVVDIRFLKLEFCHWQQLLPVVFLEVCFIHFLKNVPDLQYE